MDLAFNGFKLGFKKSKQIKFIKYIITIVKILLNKSKQSS